MRAISQAKLRIKRLGKITAYFKYLRTENAICDCKKGQCYCFYRKGFHNIAPYYEESKTIKLLVMSNPSESQVKCS